MLKSVTRIKTEIIQTTVIQDAHLWVSAFVDTFSEHSS
jgi:hypothetical protein